MSILKNLLRKEEEQPRETTSAPEPSPTLPKPKKTPTPIPTRPRIIEVGVIRDREVTIRKAGSPDEAITFRKVGRPLGRVIFKEGREPWGGWDKKISPVGNYMLLAERRGFKFIRQRILSS